jgi:hypothetical protein
MEWCYAKLGTGQPASLSSLHLARSTERETAHDWKAANWGLQNEQRITVTRRFQKFKVEARFNGTFCGNSFFIAFQNISHISTNHL